MRFPQDCGVDIWGETPTDLCGVTFVLCSEWVTETRERIREIPINPENESVFEAEEYGETVDEYVEYSFLLLYKNGWTATRQSAPLPSSTLRSLP